MIVKCYVVVRGEGGARETVSRPFFTEAQAEKARRRYERRDPRSVFEVAVFDKPDNVHFLPTQARR